MATTTLQQQIADLLQEIATYTDETPAGKEAFRLRFISRKGPLAALMGQLKDAAPEQRKALGQALNELKTAAQDKFQALEAATTTAAVTVPLEQDPTLPPPTDTLGAVHPLRQVQERITSIFTNIGFGIATGPEIESDWHNFTALNFPPNHPARAMVDTFFVANHKDALLRTHTSSVQVRFMTENKPPIRIISPGRVFRNEAISARSHCIFHQVEGLYINDDVSFADLKATLFHFVHTLFGKDTQLRLRPSYFPFTEPSAEVDISCQLCKGKGCNVCKQSGWLEIGGAGMVDPAVLKNCNIDPDKYTGFAFGMGIERMAMLLYQINDLRLFTANDIRFLQQFAAA